MATLVPREFARSNRKWQGKLPLKVFTRLCEAISNEEGDVDVLLNFSVDDNGRIRVFGQVSTTAELTCYTCMLQQVRKIVAPIDARIVDSDHEAREIFSDFDAMVLDDGRIAIQDLIEDDLILNIPTTICRDGNKCTNRPQATQVESKGTFKPFEKIGQVVKTIDNV